MVCQLLAGGVDSKTRKRDHVCLGGANARSEHDGGRGEREREGGGDEICRRRAGGGFCEGASFWRGGAKAFQLARWMLLCARERAMKELERGVVGSVYRGRAAASGWAGHVLGAILGGDQSGRCSAVGRQGFVFMCVSVCWCARARSGREEEGGGVCHNWQERVHGERGGGVSARSGDRKTRRAHVQQGEKGVMMRRPLWGCDHRRHPPPQKVGEGRATLGGPTTTATTTTKWWVEKGRRDQPGRAFFGGVLRSLAGPPLLS